MSKCQTTIRLTKEDEEGKYEQVQFKPAESLPGTVVEDAAGATGEIQTATNKRSIKRALSCVYSFIADTLFEGQLTGGDYCEGTGVREIVSLTRKLLRSVTVGLDETYTGTKRK